nr:tetratricopeptide repeat protein [Kofleriaceae bacterium]
MTQNDFVHRGQALVQAGQYQEAVKVCRLGLLGRPTTVDGRVVLGQALLALKRYDEVLAEMRVALELDQSSVPAHVLKGEALLRKGDRHAAIEALERAKTIAPEDPAIIRLLTDAERVPGGAMTSSAHPSVDFVRNTGTRNYPGGPDSEGEENTDGFTRPASPGSKRAAAVGDPRGTPSEAMLGVGDKSGTVEVDPDLEAEEIDDAGVPMTPPRAQKLAGDFEEARGKVARSRKDKPTKSGRPQSNSGPMAVVERQGPLGRQPRGNVREQSQLVELDSDDLVEVDDSRAAPAPQRQAPPARGEGPGTRVRNAVGMPSGPLGSAPAPMRAPPPPSQPPPLAQAIARAPHVIEMTPLAPMPQVGANAPTMMLPPIEQPGWAATAPAGLSPLPPQQRSMPGMQPMPPMPTMAGAPMPQPASLSQQIAAMPLIAPTEPPFGSPLPPTPPQSAYMQQQLAATQPPMPSPLPPHMLQPPTPPPFTSPLDSGVVATIAPSVAMPSEGTRDPARSGVRKPRSKLSLVIWFAVGAAVIGGGVFAGLQIRAMRLDSQIEVAREQATEQAKPDTWVGWTAARDSLANIVQASTALENRAALARVKGLLAYELGDNIADAKAAVESLKGQPGVDADVAAAYVALAFDDLKTAKQHADAAAGEGSGDAEAIYVSGLAQVLGGDYPTGIATLQRSLDADPRALPTASYARALADTGAYDAAVAAIDKGLKAYPDNPQLVIARARTLAVAGRVAPGASSADLRAQLGHVIDEGGKPVAEQTRGVSPAQLAFAILAEVRVEFARGNQTGEQAALRQLVAVAIDDQRFAEETIDTFAAVGETASAKSAADRALAIWPQSRRATIALAQLQLAAGQPAQALDTLKKVADATTLPTGLVTRADARAATGDLDGARADYDTTIKRMPGYERAVLGLIAMDLKAGDVASARKLADKAADAAGKGAPSLAVAIAYTAVARAGTDAAALDKAKGLLDKAIKASGGGPDVTRAQVELARIDRDQGNLRAARDLYAEASRAGSVDAKLESALLLGESDPNGARDSLEQLVKELAGAAPGPILVELGHARMVVGDHDGAEAALDAADRALPAGAPRWQLDRERARLALRRGDVAAAGVAIDRAIDSSGSDADTLLLAADVVATDAELAQDAKGTPKLGALEAKLRKEAAARLAGRPEAQLVTGDLALAEGKTADATAAFDAANTALAKQPPGRLQARVLFGLAVVAYRANNLAEARNKLEAVIALDPANYEAYLYAIDIIVHDKDATGAATAQALDWARQVVRYQPASVYGWYYLGVLGKKAGQDKLLADAITMVSQLAPTSDLVHELQQLKR